MRKERKNELPMFSLSCRVRWLIRKRDGTHTQHTLFPRGCIYPYVDLAPHTLETKEHCQLICLIAQLTGGVHRMHCIIRQRRYHFSFSVTPEIILSLYFFNKKNSRGDMGKKNGNGACFPERILRP